MTPDKPIAKADGPVAQLTLRTENSGTGSSDLLFAFSVLVYLFNSTDNSSQLVSEEERFNSSEYTNNESVKIHVEDVMKLNQLYRFAARAINVFGVSEISALSDAVLLNVSGNYGHLECHKPMYALFLFMSVQECVLTSFLPFFRANHK